MHLGLNDGPFVPSLPLSDKIKVNLVWLEYLSKVAIGFCLCIINCFLCSFVKIVMK